MADPVIQKLGYTVDETNEAIKRTLAVINKDNQINGNAIPSGAITGPKLGANSVTTGKIAPGTIEASDINQSAFDSTLQEKGKLAEAKVVGDKLKEQGDSINDLAKKLNETICDIESPEYVRLEMDKDGNILSSIDKEGVKTEYLPTDFTKPVKIKGRDVLAEIDHKQDVISDLEEIRTKSEKAVQDDDIVNLVTKDEVDVAVKSTISVDNPEYKKVEVDSEKRVLSAVDNNNVKSEYLPVDFTKEIRYKGIALGEHITSVVLPSSDKINNPEYVRVLLDKSKKIIVGIDKDGVINIFGKIFYKGEELVLGKSDDKTLAKLTELVGNITSRNNKNKYLIPLASLKRTTLDKSSGTGQPTTAYKNVSLYCISDTHGYIDGIKDTVNIWQTYKTYIDDALVLGDVAPRHWESYSEAGHDGIAHYNEMLKVIGNHDVYAYPDKGSLADYQNKAYYAPDNEKYRRYFKGINGWNVVQPTGYNDSASPYYCACYYYKDYVGSNVRLIVLDCMNWTDAQETWFKAVLEDARTREYHVVVCQHIAQARPDFDEFTDSAWNSLDIPLTLSDNVNNKVILHVQDFIDKGGIFVCWLCGHNHIDKCGTIKGYPNQLYVILPTSNSYAGSRQDITRFEDSDSQYISTVFSVEPRLKYIRLYRLGANIDRNLRKREVLCIDYNNHKIIYER